MLSLHVFRFSSFPCPALTAKEKSRRKKAAEDKLSPPRCVILPAPSYASSDQAILPLSPGFPTWIWICFGLASLFLSSRIFSTPSRIPP